MINPHELAQRHRLDILTPASHDLKGDALDTLRGAEGRLSAEAVHYAGEAIRSLESPQARG